MTNHTETTDHQYRAALGALYGFHYAVRHHSRSGYHHTAHGSTFYVRNDRSTDLDTLLTSLAQDFADLTGLPIEDVSVVGLVAV